LTTATHDDSLPTHAPELLAPAGDWECLHAAAANGADAVYFGVQHFNARLRADNFRDTELPAIFEWLHARGLRGFVTLNTLVFQSELSSATRLLSQLEAAHADAVIVQDLGICRLARQVCPSVEIHASTQMTITSPEGLDFAADLGISRAVLARELSVRELRKFHDQHRVPLEVFVHGALCVAYSGQCLTSETLGQRSANRGECAQACRLPYTLVVDGHDQNLGDRRYLLSPQDLAALELIPELTALGIASFKIEGRLKSPEYVAAVTRAYRMAIDAATGARTSLSGEEISRKRYELEMAFSRGLDTGWLKGVNHQKLVHARFGKKRGAFVGTVRSVANDHVRADISCPVAPGDGLVFDTGGNTDREQGGRLYEIRGDKLYFERNRIRFHLVPPGTRIWKTDDPALDKEWKKTFAQEPPPKPLPLHITATGCAGSPLTLTVVCGQRSTQVQSSLPLAPADKRPLDSETLTQQLGRLGGTAYSLASLTLEMEDPVMLPLSELNRMRRTLVESLDKFDTSAPPSTSHAPAPQLVFTREESALTARATPPLPHLHALCRTVDQARAAVATGANSLTLDFEDIRRYKEAIQSLRTPTTPPIYLATPRIQKAGEEGFFRLIESCSPNGVLVRNLGGISHFRQSGLHAVGDFTLNCANAWTAEHLIASGLERITISADLNAAQVCDLLRAAPPAWFEIALHLHMPMFHMEHCVFAAFLSDGTDHTNCGRPCEKHRVTLRDRVGAEHPLHADVGCRNTLFHQKAQSGAQYHADFSTLGARHFRVELLGESAEETRAILTAYRALLDGKTEGKELLTRVKAANQFGVTSGTLTVLS